MKRFYTVKEAAKILGFSTNTVYKYLDEGKLIGKRIGQGRFKIPYPQLEPYLGEQEKIGSFLKKEVTEEEDSIEKVVENIGNQVCPRDSDFIFSRLFWGFVLVGMGVIYLFWNPLGSLFSLLNLLLGGGILVSGIFMLLVNILWEESKLTKLFSNLFSLTFLFSASIIFSFLGNFSSLVITLTLFIVIITAEILRKKVDWQDCSSFREFALLSLIGVLIIGLISLIFPEVLIFDFLKNFVISYKLPLILIILVGFCFPLTFLLTSQGLLTKIEYLLFPVMFVLAVAATLGSINKNQWDVAYVAYLYSVFTLFMLWWKNSGRKIGDFSYHLLLTIFVWIMAGILLGLLAIFGLQEKVKAEAVSVTETELAKASDNFDNFFKVMDASFNKKIIQLNLKSVLTRGNEEEAIAAAKDFYESTPNLKRIILYDKEGVGVGVYPRDTIAQGANYSSRDYFQITKNSLRPYISNIFESIVNTEAVVKTLPIVEGNEFKGMVGASLDLEKLSLSYQLPISGWKVYVFDENGKYVLNLETAKIGEKAPEEIIKASKSEKKVKNPKVVRVFDEVRTPKWTIYAERSSEDLVKGLSSINLIISLMIYINTGISLCTGFVLARKWRKKE